MGLVAVRRIVVARLVVQHEFTGRPSDEADIERADVGKDRRLLGAGIPERERPLDGGKSWYSTARQRMASPVCRSVQVRSCSVRRLSSAV